MHIEGGCHCGNIAYEAEIDPEQVRICHCTDCQTLTGSAYRTTVNAPAESFKLLKGQPKIYIKTAESGTQRAQGFCGDCGTPIYATSPTNQKSYGIRVGSIRQRAQLQPKQQGWYRSALSWTQNISSLPHSEKGPS